MLPKTHMSFHVLCCFLPLPLNRAAAANDYVPVHNYTTQRANGVVSDNVEIFPHPTMRARQAAALWWALRKFPSTTLDQTPAYSCLGRRSIKQNHTQRETSSGRAGFQAFSTEMCRSGGTAEQVLPHSRSDISDRTRLPLECVSVCGSKYFFSWLCYFLRFELFFYC